MKFDISYTFDAIPRLLEGAFITLQVAILGFFLSIILATTITIARTSLKSKILNLIIAFYISFIRGTPLLVQIFLIYYVLPVFGLNLGPFTAGIVAITINSAAFVTEILRGGLASVPIGQFEADMKSRGLEGFKELKLFTAHPEATLALANGTCDAQTQTVPNLAVVAKKQKGVFELVGPITDKTYMAWVTRPEDTDLRDYISSKILEMRDSGKIDAIQDKWFGFRMPIPSDGHLPEGAL